MYIFKNLSFDLLNSRGLAYRGLKFRYSFKMHASRELCSNCL